ncbi:imidazole glycerol phosphate synthase subunit HisF [Capillibacterium thermochitinicola]|uniref:Imidazole glycerol phosphate synthase subunit HisF n=1 Tax=Capillibacterium thermochitinicola TaxID=2699427 RepID=A0A8J6I2F3_9FIRM|nr:imidazole glycerol phosphate synthase subunit HisF [Capillibacterium thermochitinicola]MBA2134171.1 imidazole glycerol phosphate synthase subunit HisF [Capillibacterium thermochitinicola]
MQEKRIIPCLDVCNGRVVKGVNFENLRDAGDPVELAAFYDQEGADELVFLDIMATSEGRQTMVDVVAKTARQISIPLTVGGGIRDLEGMRRLLEAGAAKVAVSSAAVKDPSLLAAGAKEFGRRRIIAAIDARKEAEGFWRVYINGGKVPTQLDAVTWAKEVAALGAGEILLTSMDKDGTEDGYDLELTAAVREQVQIPVIASGGAGNLEHLWAAIVQGKADAVLCASIFHFRRYTIAEAKQFLADRGVKVRL